MFRAMLSALFIMIPSAAFAQQKQPICMPLPEMMTILGQTGFAPLLSTHSVEEKKGTIVYINSEDKTSITIIFDMSSDNPKTAGACVVSVQKNLRFNREGLDYISKKELGIRV
jgi:hypothetical protein